GKVDRIGLLRTELVDTEGTALEKARGLEPMRLPEVAIVVAIEAPAIYAELAQQSHGLGGVELQLLDHQRAAASNPGAAGTAQLVALGVTAEVVVVVEHQDLRVCAVKLAEEVRRRQPADAAADDRQIVVLVEVGQRAGGVPSGSIAQRMGDLEGSGMVAAHPGQCGRVVSGIRGGNPARQEVFFRSGVRTVLEGCRQRLGHQRRAGNAGHAVEEVPARDGRRGCALRLAVQSSSGSRDRACDPCARTGRRRWKSSYQYRNR